MRGAAEGVCECLAEPSFDGREYVRTNTKHAARKRTEARLNMHACAKVLGTCAEIVTFVAAVKVRKRKERAKKRNYA